MTIIIQQNLLEKIKEELRVIGHTNVDTGQLNPNFIAQLLKKEFPDYNIEPRKDENKMGGQIYIYRKWHI